MTKDNKHRRTFLEVMVDQGHPTKEIMKWKDCWDWQETSISVFLHGVSVFVISGTSYR
tara:strand:- start:137 stop:310 length:174 start_codon:yes stop_codon:yes gene_type:complete